MNIFLLFLFLNLYYCKKVIIPFNTIKNNNSNNILSLLQNQIYTKLEIGTPKQTIYLGISTELSLFEIDSYLINDNFYSIKKSKSYKATDIPAYEEYKRIKEKLILNETFYFQDSLSNDNLKTYNNLMFNYITELSSGFTDKDYGYIDDDNLNLISGVIGLQVTRKYSLNENIILIKSLKNIEAIDKLLWSIIYKNDHEGYLIFGEYPHEYNKSYYNENNLKKTNCIFDTQTSEFYWDFIFTDITVGEKKINSERSATYAPQSGVIIGPDEYKNLISDFFQNFTKNDKCSLNEIEYKKSTYLYYECNKDIDINNFEPIVFVHHEFEQKFILDKNDLFADFGNKKIFLIFFKKENNKKWMLGGPFTKKYFFTFDHDSKMIFYYNKLDNGADGNNKIWILYIIISFLGVLSIFLGIYIGKQVFSKKKKKRANELDDNDEENEYKESINDNNREDIPNSDYNKIEN